MKSYREFLKITNSKTILFLGKKLLIGPDYKNFILTFIILNLASILMYIFYWKLNFLFILGLVLLILVNIFMLLTSFTDPGIVPKLIGNFNGFRNKMFKNVFLNINGSNYIYKKCFCCLNYRSYKTIHCYICNNCVLNYDHHCPWLSNCIGKRNYWYYYLFIWISSIYFIINLYIIIFYFLKQIKSTYNIIIFVIFMILNIFGFIFNFGLLIFHSYLIINNKSTNEYLKRLDYQDDSKIFRFIKDIAKNSFLNFNIEYSKEIQICYNDNVLKTSPLNCFKNNKIEDKIY